ncbi:GNAT family N-acetyltransferase [Roseivirga sp.]|uniref:GNAT family N-acetyltransferase n=1 Tax=Roseivirga sp. TaxID=1964215 RepID=UPI003B51A755
MYQVKELTDLNRLDEIFRLRVVAYEHSDQRQYINSETYPQGFYDDLDKKSRHFIIENEGQIIACARLISLESLSQIPYYNLNSQALPIGWSPFWYYSRIAIHPDFMKMGLSLLIDEYIINQLKGQEFYLVILAKVKTQYYRENHGFRLVETITGYDSPDYPFSKQRPTELLIKKLSE